MIDWFVLLTPVHLLPIVLLFVFVGCQLVFTVDEPLEEPTDKPPDEPPSQGPVFVELVISAGCDVGIGFLDITVTSDISAEVFHITLAAIPSQGIPLPTLTLAL